MRLTIAQLRQLANIIENAGQVAADIRLASTDGLTTTLTVHIDNPRRGFLLYSDGSTEEL